MKSFVSYITQSVFTVVTAAVVGVLLVVGLVSAATTISTSVLTAGGVYASSTAAFDGLVSLYAGASTTSFTLLNGETISNGTDGTITLGATNLVLVGTASTSAIKVGDEASPTTINGLVFGYCTIPSTTITASSTAYADCTGATGVIENDRVFVQATSSLPTKFIVQAASSTATAGTINVRIYNTGYADGVPTASNATTMVSFNFWAAR